MNIKTIIRKELQKNGKYVNHWITKEALEKRGILDEIYNITSFLDSDCKIIERFYVIMNNIKTRTRCYNNFCNNNVKFLGTKRGYREYCSRSCVSKSKKVLKLKEKNSIKKYGIKDPTKTKEAREKRKNTCIKKYGDSNFFATDYFQVKSKKTCIKRYGIDNYAKTKECKEKVKKTSMDRFGEKYYMKTDEYKKRIKETNIKNIGAEFNFTTKKFLLNRKYKTYNKYIDEIKEVIVLNKGTKEFIKKFLNGVIKLREKHIFTCKKCNKEFNSTLYHLGPPNCPYCAKKRRSIGETEIEQFLANISINNIISNDRNVLEGKELDIYLPDNHLAIEFDGIMWHSVGQNKGTKFFGINLETEIKQKHIYKTTECNKQNIQLLHIFENEWSNSIKQEIWKNIIKNKLGTNKTNIYGINTTIKLVSNEASKNFLNMYHLQGNASSKLKIGLYSAEGNLLQLMTFGKSKYDRNTDWKLIRFSTKNGVNIIGGASKIFKYFVNNYMNDGQSIITYTNLRYSNGNTYRKLGFELIKQTKPNYFYFKSGTLCLESRYNYQKNKLKDKIENFDKNLTESENMYNNNYRKIYDCGNLVFKYIKK